jgi:hypothetical protein
LWQNGFPEVTEITGLESFGLVLQPSAFAVSNGASNVTIPEHK